MVIITCFKCDVSFDMSLDTFEQDEKNLSQHFRLHGIKASERYDSITCGYENCSQSFFRLNSYKSHILKKHLSFVRPISDEQFEFSRINYEAKFIRMLAEIKVSNVSCSSSSIDRFADAAAELLRESMDDAVEKMKKFLMHKNIDVDAKETEQFLTQFTIYKNFNTYKNVDGQIKAIKKVFKYVDPVECQLGKEGKIKKPTSSASENPKETFKTFMYIPVDKTIEMILNNQEVITYVNSEEKENDPEKISSYRNSKSFQEHPFFRKYPRAIRIKIHYDEFLPNNPLGSKTHGNKIGAFYFSVDNLPEDLRLFIGNVHTFALAYDQDVRQYGISEILKPFMKDLRRMESDEGVEIEVLNSKYILRATVICFCGDTLAAHEVLGFLGPGAKHFCRVCNISREQLSFSSFIPKIERSREQHDTVLEEMSRCQFKYKRDELRTQSGIKENSLLNDSKYFHCTNNIVFDGVHDLFEGQFMYSCKLFLNAITNRPEYELNVDALNWRIENFNYGPHEVVNKPSPNFTDFSLKKQKDHKLQQSAAQIRCLIKVSPFIVSDKIDPEDDLILFITNIGKITDIYLAPEIDTSIVPVLQHLIEEHDKMFRELFPDADFINKLHHIFHTVKTMLLFGSAQNYLCFLYEAKHKYYKAIARASGNYINQISTLSRIGQMSESAIWGAEKKQIRQKFVYSFSETFSLEDLDYGSLIISRGLNFSKDFQVQRLNHLKIYSTTYQVGSFVAIHNGSQNDVNLFPLFGEILEIFLTEKEAFFVYQEWPATGFVEALNAYQIQKRDTLDIISASNLWDPKPFDCWMSYRNPEEKYICQHHLLL